MKFLQLLICWLLFSLISITENEIITSISSTPIILKDFDFLNGKNHFLSSDGKQFAQIDLSDNIRLWSIDGTEGSLIKEYPHLKRELFKNISFFSNISTFEVWEKSLKDENLGHLFILQDTEIKFSFNTRFYNIRGYKNVFAFSSSLRLLAFVSEGEADKFEVWDVEENKLLWQEKLEKEQITSFVFSEDEQILAVKGLMNGDIYLFDVINKNKIKTLSYKDISDPFYSSSLAMIISKDKTQLITRSTNVLGIYIWDIAKSIILHRGVFHDGDIKTSPDGKYFVYSDVYGRVIVWSIEHKQIAQVIEVVKYKTITNIEFSLEGDFLYISYANKIEVYQIISFCGRIYFILTAQSSILENERITKIVADKDLERSFITYSTLGNLVRWKF